MLFRSRAVTRSGNQITLGWDAAPGRVYRIEYKDALGAATWTQLGGDRPATSSNLSVTVDVGAPPKRFFRVVVAD